VTIDVLANDTIAPDVNETLSLASVGPAGNGTAAMVGNQVQYTPAADFFGSDSFTYTITDGNGGSDTATVNVTVNPTNDPPTVVDDAVTTVKNTTESFDVLANDLITPDVGETLTIASLGTPSEGGTVAIVGNQIQYTPLPDFIGTETVTYVADDGNGGTDDGVLTITVLDFVPSNVGGMVFDDVNNDGLVDGDGTGRERGIAGIEIRLFGTDDFGDPVDMTTMTGPDGSYEFDRLPPGTYTLQQGPVPFMQDGIDTPGVGGTIADNDTFTIQLDQDTDAIGYNFGELGLQPQYIDIRDIMHSTPDEGVLLAVDEAGGMLWYTLLDGWGDYSGMTAELSDDMSELHIQAVDGAMGDLDLVLPVDNARYVQERGDIGEAHLLRILGSPADLIAALDAAMAEA